MAPPKRQLKVSNRSLPKHLADRLHERLEKVREDPTLLLPTCDHAGGCPRPALERSLRRVQRVAESRARLKRMSRRGTPLARGYAGALDLLFDEELRLMGGFPNPFGGGEVKYAQRGNAKREVQAGVQNYEDKGVRLLAYIPYARGFRGAYYFSSEAGVLCSGRSPVPPQAYLEEVAVSQRPPLAAAGDDFACPHLRAGDETLPREVERTHLASRFRESPATLRMCRVCAGEGSLASSLRRYAIGPKLKGQVESWVELRPQCNETGVKSCHFDQRIDLTEEEQEALERGTSTNAEAMAGALKRAAGALEAGGGGFVLAGGACYGSDAEAIVASFQPAPEMRRALDEALKGLKEDLVLDSLTPAKVLSKFWTARGAEILEAACGNRAVAEEVLAEAKPNEPPPSLIQRAVKRARAAAIDEALPTFGHLSAEAALADRIARAHRRGGPEAAMKEIEAGRTLSASAGAVAWAFLAALNKSGGRDWQFSKVEVERGAVARKDARALLECRAEEYAGALNRTLQSLGIHEDVEATTT